MKNDWNITVGTKFSYCENLKWEKVLEINKYASYKKNVSCRNVQNFLKFLKNLVKPPKNHFKPLFGLSEVWDSEFQKTMILKNAQFSKI